MTPQVLVKPSEKKTSPLELFCQLLKVSSEEWVSCKNIIPLFEIFSLNYSNILMHFLDDFSRLTLFDKKFKISIFKKKKQKKNQFDNRNNCCNKRKFIVLEKHFFFLQKFYE